MSNDYTLPPVPRHPSPTPFRDDWTALEVAAILANGHACAEAARAPLAEENARLKARLRSVCQTLVAAVGADGPCNAEDAAARAVARIAELEAENSALAESIALGPGASEVKSASQEIDRLRAEVEAKAGELEKLRDHLREHLRAAVACQNSVVETRGADGMDRLSFANDKARALLAQPATPWVNPLAAEVSSLRRLLFNAYTAPGMGYTDDGELQDSTVHPPIDFLRMTPEQIQEAIRRREGKGGRLGELAAEVEKYRADAERYRWLLKNGKPAAEGLVMRKPEFWTEAIDAARKGEGVAGA